MNKKGFTLIELLAVIVILAIIALIATPIVLNIIKDSKESSQLQSAQFYLNAVETAVAKKIMDDATFKPTICDIKSDGNLNCETKEVKVEINGETPIGGRITLKEGKIEEIKLKYNNDKIITYDENKKIIYAKPEPYRESENIEIPDLYNNTLTPVIYDGDNWVIADATEKWYDYSKQEWANAVILNKDVKKDIGDPITVDGENPDALAMFVWIPRYEYKIEGTYGKGGTSKTSPGEIEVNFITKDTKQASETYIIHPAFNFGGEDISGIWVGKFELSHTTKTTSSLGCTTETCNESDNLRIIPNVQSLRNNSVSSFFYAIRSMSKEKNVFGINLNKTDTHMIKNSEWGAVAYLSQSKYGKYGNNSYEITKKEVYINNSNRAYTGRSGGSYGGNTAANSVYLDKLDVTNQNVNTGYYTYDGYLLEYDTNNKTLHRDMSKVASTTGNMYGVYDMSGGASEYVMGAFANSDGEKWSGTDSSRNSGFKGKIGEDGIDVDGLEWPNEKYYDLYKASSGITIGATTACNGGICFGHAFSETSGWYGNYAGFIRPSYPWLIRGGTSFDGSNAGIFYSYTYNGGTNASYSARVVLTQST